MRRALAITLALFALLLALALSRYAPPAAVPRSADVAHFSAERARDFQTLLVGDGSTRAVGTPGNDRARQYIIEQLGKSGWSVETQRAMSCTYHGACAPIVNVVARLVGTQSLMPGVLVSAHYDSVPVSPGASDDGVGVAVVLETARALAAGARPMRTIVMLLADGEESGLLGADAFVRGHAEVGLIKYTVNVDSRGSRGPSQMFETSAGNAGVVALMAAKLDRPVTSSLYYEVYKRLPNDTDFSLTKTIGTGVNFANTLGIEDYHTPLDRLDVADIGTLQHHGDHVLGMTRAFAALDAVTRSDIGADAVWFDVMASFIVHWPAQWSSLLGLVALALLVGQAIRARLFDRGLLVFVVQLALGSALALVFGAAAKALGAFPAFFVAEPRPALGALHASGAAGALAGGFLCATRATPRSLWLGTWIAWALVGAVVATFAPGVSYVFIVPAFVAALAGSLPFAVALVLPAAVAATLVLPLAIAMYGTLGFVAPAAIPMPTILLATTLAPMLVTFSQRVMRGVPLGLGITAAVALVAALVVPKFSVAVPQRTNVVFRQEEGKAKAFVDPSWGPALWGPPPASMVEALGGPLGSEPALPWTLAAPFTAVAAIDARPPTLDVLEAAMSQGHRRIKARARSLRGAPTLALLLPRARHAEIKIEGHYATPRGLGDGGQLLVLLAVPADGLAIELDIADGETFPVTLLDRTLGVPAGSKAEAAVRARPPTAVPTQDGDVTVLQAAIAL